MSKIKSIINKIILQEMKNLKESTSFENALNQTLKSYKKNELAAMANAVRGSQSPLGQSMWSHLYQTLGGSYQIADSEITKNKDLILNTIDDLMLTK